jgi:hypothetical protein
LPEIIWQVNEKAGTIKVDCAACGNHSQLKHGHKLITYILKHPPVAAKKGKGGKEYVHLFITRRLRSESEILTRFLCTVVFWQRQEGQEEQEQEGRIGFGGG